MPIDWDFVSNRWTFPPFGFGSRRNCNRTGEHFQVITIQSSKQITSNTSYFRKTVIITNETCFGNHIDNIEY